MTPIEMLELLCADWTKEPAELIAKRTSMGMTQRQFWHSFGITQSSGSRHEAGVTQAPLTARIVMTLKCGTQEQREWLLDALTPAPTNEVPFDQVRDKPRRSGRGRIARTA